MPNIVGTIGKVLPTQPNVTGLVWVNFDSPVIDTTTTPDTITPTTPASYAIANGVINFNLPETQSQNITATFRIVTTASVESFYMQDGELYEGARFQHTDNQWYTGQAPLVAGVNKLLTRTTRAVETEIIPPFSTYIPNVATIEIWSLMPRSITPGNIWAGSWAVAEVLTTDARFVDRLPKGLEYLSDYVAATSYRLNQVVKRDGNLYIWINAATASGKDPLVTANVRPSVGAFWDLFIPKGVPGGTGAQLVGYNAAAWNNSTEAAARGDVEDAIAGLAPPDLSNYVTTAALSTAINPLAPRANPVFTGRVQRPAITFPIPAGDRATEVVTESYMRDAIAALGGGSFSLKDIAIFEERQAQNVAAGGAVAGANRRNLNNDIAVPNWASRSGRTITLQAGSYLMQGEACASGIGQHRCFIVSVSNTTGTAIGRIAQGRSHHTIDLSIADNEAPNDWAVCGVSPVIVFANPTMIELWHWVEQTRTVNGLGKITNEPSQPEIYARLTVWKVA